MSYARQHPGETILFALSLVGFVVWIVLTFLAEEQP